MNDDLVKSRTDPQHAPRDVVMLAVMAFIHAVRVFVLTPAQDNDLLWLFAFDPVRYGGVLPDGAVPGGCGAEIWTFFTYALLHAELDASRRQRDLAARLRLAGGASVRHRAFRDVLRGDGGRRRHRASVCASAVRTRR